MRAKLILYETKNKTIFNRICAGDHTFTQMQLTNPLSHKVQKRNLWHSSLGKCIACKKFSFPWSLEYVIFPNSP